MTLVTDAVVADCCSNQAIALIIPHSKVCLTVATPSDSTMCKVKSWLSQLICAIERGMHRFWHILPIEKQASPLDKTASRIQLVNTTHPRASLVFSPVKFAFFRERRVKTPGFTQAFSIFAA